MKNLVLKKSSASDHIESLNGFDVLLMVRHVWIGNAPFLYNAEKICNFQEANTLLIVFYQPLSANPPIVAREDFCQTRAEHALPISADWMSIINGAYVP